MIAYSSFSCKDIRAVEKLFGRTDKKRPTQAFSLRGAFVRFAARRFRR